MARQVGSQVSSVFNENGGKNQHGFEVVSILLATEPGGSNISTTKSIADLNGYQVAGIDSVDDGNELREGFQYYRGEPISRWPVNDRRRVIVINGAANSSTHQQWEILQNVEIPNSSAMVDLVDSVEMGSIEPEGVDYETWAADIAFADGESGRSDDPDGDGAENFQEFAADTDPLNQSSIPLTKIEMSPGGMIFRYRMAADRIGIEVGLQIGQLESFADFTPATEPTVTEISENLNEFSILLPQATTDFVRINVKSAP